MAVNFSGMCCTMTMPGLTRGKAVSTASSAWVPPVEVPMAMSRSVVCAMACWLGASMASALSLVLTGTEEGLPTRLRLAWAAARTAMARSWADSCRKLFIPMVGLVMMSTAPAAIACRVVSAPFSVREEQITTGVGCSAMILVRK